MNADLPDQAPPEPEHSRRKVWMIIGIASIIFALFTQDVLGWFAHGGIFSFVAAARAVNAKASSVDVDRGAFVGIGLALFSAAACSVCYVSNAPTKKILYLRSDCLGRHGTWIRFKRNVRRDDHFQFHAFAWL